MERIVADTRLVRNRYGLWEGQFLIPSSSDMGSTTIPQSESRKCLLLAYEAEQSGLSAIQVATIGFLRVRGGEVIAIARDAARLTFPQVGTAISYDDSGLSLLAIHVHSARIGDLACVGFEFDADWNKEKGVGVLTCGLEVLTTGDADVSTLSWVANENAIKYRTSLEKQAPHNR